MGILLVNVDSEGVGERAFIKVAVPTYSLLLSQINVPIQTWLLWEIILSRLRTFRFIQALDAFLENDLIRSQLLFNRALLGRESTRSILKPNAQLLWINFSKRFLTGYRLKPLTVILKLPEKLEVSVTLFFLQSFRWSLLIRPQLYSFHFFWVHNLLLIFEGFL